MKGFRPGHDPVTKEQKEKQKDFQKRQEAMIKEVREISVKYRIDIVGALDYRQNGVVPLVAFMDVKDKYEAEAKAKAEKERNDPANKTLIV